VFKSTVREYSAFEHLDDTSSEVEDPVFESAVREYSGFEHRENEPRRSRRLRQRTEHKEDKESAKEQLKRGTAVEEGSSKRKGEFIGVFIPSRERNEEQLDSEDEEL